MVVPSTSRPQPFFFSFSINTAVIIFLLPLLFSLTGGTISDNNNKLDEEWSKMVLGSRPPACVNKCMSCRPCTATLVVPPRREDDDGGYYLLSWKCRCGKRIYQP